MPRPAALLLTGRGGFGFSTSNQGFQFYRERGSTQILVCLCVLVRWGLRLTYAPVFEGVFVFACVILASELQCCWSSIRALADASKAGMSSQSSRKVSCGSVCYVSLWELSKKRGCFTCQWAKLQIELSTKSGKNS